MLLSFCWLKEILEIKEDLSQIAQLLTAKGIAVENILNYGQFLDGFQVAEITEITENHLILSLGKEEYKLERVEGVKVKDKIGFRRQDKKILTGEEINLGNGLIILDQSFPPGEKLNKLLDDYVLELETTTNRGDLLSVFGIARELAIFLDCEVKKEELAAIPEIEPPADSLIKLEMESKDDCPSYIGRIISEVKVAPSPFSLQWRLFVSGIRPHSNVVDATNYTLLKYGQPLHPFDLNRVFGEKIIVRRAKPKEKIKTIDGAERELSPEILVIADSLRPIAIAGIIGGANSEIVAGTKNVFLECAHFQSSVIRKGSLSLRLRTEASRRFELGIDEGNLKTASDFASLLIAHLTGGKIPKGIIGEVEKPKEKSISLSPIKVSQILGVPLENTFILNALQRMGFSPQGKKKIKVTIPSYRKDIKEEIDLIEEMARFYDYKNIPDDFSLSTRTIGKRDVLGKKLVRLSFYLVDNGFSEVKSNTFINEETLHSLGFESYIKVQNPLNKNLSLLRPSLLPTLLEVISHNFRNGNKDLRLFEIGKVYTRKEKDQYQEHYHLALILAGAPQPLFWQKEKTAYDFFDLKGIFASLCQFLSHNEPEFFPATIPFFTLGKGVEIKTIEKIGYLGELKSDILKSWDIDTPVWFGEISLINLLAPKDKFYQPIPNWFPVVRDFSFLFDKKLPAQDVLKFIGDKFAGQITNCEIFDYFSGPPLPPDKKNLGIRITLPPSPKTEMILTEIVSAVTEQFQGRLRQKCKEDEIRNEPNQEERENRNPLSEKINNLTTELKRLKEENRQLREILNIFHRREEKLRKKLTRLLDKIEKNF